MNHTINRDTGINRDPGRWRLVAVLVLAAVLLGGVPAMAATTDPRLDLKLLVVTDGRANVDALVTQLQREGVPYKLIDTREAGRETVTASLLATTAGGQPRGFFQGVVLPHEKALSDAERAALDAYERQFKVRRLVAYTWAQPELGLDYARWNGTVDGMAATVTEAAKADGFGYLAGQVPIDDVNPAVQESYAALATPAPTLPAGATFTPYVTMPVPDDGAVHGSVIGVYAHDGREQMVSTISFNENQNHAKVLTHGIVEWLTRGVHLGMWRNWFSVHVDDVFLPDDRWHTQANCTVGDNCNAQRDPTAEPYNTPIRMVPADVDALIAWQRTNGIKLDMAYNGGGAVEAGAGDPLTAALLKRKGELRWINHTYQHPYLGCVQDFSTVPWQCAKTAAGAVRWTTRATIRTQISQNITWARGKGITVNDDELITGEHSGLRTLPQMPTDNPNLGRAMADTGVKYVASDASRELATRILGPARTVPRHPMNIFYNVATREEEVDEYNWIYTSESDGGSGICTANAATSTCIEPLPGPRAFDDYIVPIEARIALGHVLASDPRPHYAHQSNLAEDRILYPVLDRVLDGYRSRYAGNTPLLNPRMVDVAEQLRRADAWRAAVAAGRIEGYLVAGRVTIVNRTGGRLDVPASMPSGTSVVAELLGIERATGPYGQAYGTGHSTWTAVGAGGRLLLRLPPGR